MDIAVWTLFYFKQPHRSASKCHHGEDSSLTHRELNVFMSNALDQVAVERVRSVCARSTESAGSCSGGGADRRVDSVPGRCTPGMVPLGAERRVWTLSPPTALCLSVCAPWL